MFQFYSFAILQSFFFSSLLLILSVFAFGNAFKKFRFPLYLVLMFLVLQLQLPFRKAFCAPESEKSEDENCGIENTTGDNTLDENSTDTSVPSFKFFISFSANYEHHKGIDRLNSSINDVDLEILRLEMLDNSNLASDQELENIITSIENPAGCKCGTLGNSPMSRHLTPFKFVIGSPSETSVYNYFGFCYPFEIFGYTFGLPLLWGCSMLFFSMLSNIVLWLCLIYPEFNKKKDIAVNLVVKHSYYDKIKIYFEKYNYYNKIKTYFKNRIFNYLNTLSEPELLALKKFFTIMSFVSSSAGLSMFVYLIHLAKIM
jgi:hypothetical protein